MSDTLASHVDFDAQFRALAQRGILFSDADKEKFRQICTEELNQNDSITAPGLLYQLFSFIQNLFSGLDFQHLGDSFSALSHHTGEQTTLYNLQQAAMHIRQRFEQEGGSFVQAAELVSGASANDQTLPASMPESIYLQLRPLVDLAPGTTTRLNHDDANPATPVSPTSTVTIAQSNPQLTPR